MTVTHIEIAGDRVKAIPPTTGPYKCPLCKMETGRWIVYQLIDSDRRKGHKSLIEETLPDFPSRGARLSLCKKHAEKEMGKVL